MDPGVRLIANLRRRLSDAVREQGTAKVDATIDLIGCSSAQLRDYLEARFLPGMTWANYGLWHVDHVKPVAAFNLKDEHQQRECFHWTNLQPLWWADNIAKGAYWEG